MSDTNSREHEAMYCHGCHHQWRREGESIECPACSSASTEIITADDDPRHFHTGQPTHVEAEQESHAPSPAPDTVTSTQAPPPVYGPERPPVSSQASAPNQGPTSTHQFIFAPTLISFNIIPHHVPPASQTQPVATPEQHPQGPQPVTWFSMQFVTPRFHPPPPPPPSGTNSPPTGSTADVTGEQPGVNDQPQAQPQNHQTGQQHNGPFMAPTGFMTAILASLFDPAGAMMFGNGDGVYSQEAFDRIITRLREANANSGGAPPASQSAIDKLQTKEVDDEMLGSCDEKPKCVICVDEMAKGDKASVLPCNHLFHGECVTPWLKQHNTCPVCRRSIEEDGASKPAKTADEVQDHEPQQHHENAPSATDCV